MKVPVEADRHVERGARLARTASHKNALTVGVGLSTALHVAAVLLYSVVIRQWAPGDTVISVATPTRTSDDMRVVRLVEISLPELSVEPPDEAAETTEVPPGVSTGSEPPDEPDERPGGRRASDVLRVRSADTRLWREALPEAFQLTEAERMQLELAGRIEEWADSVAAVVAAEYALTDWTTTDEQGRRWGVSPGKLHLGDITLPLPFYFSGNSIQREQAARRAWEDQTILDGANAQALRDSWEERAEAIRRRRDGEREPQVAQSDSSGTSGR